MIINELQQNTPEWHDWRKNGIGGSDAPVITGESPYRTPLQLFREKTGTPIEGDEQDNEFIFSKGHQTESVIRKQFQDLTGVEMRPVCIIHPTIDFVRASLDGYDSKLGVLEAKLVGQYALERARDNEIPHHHMTQIQHQLAACGADIAQWFGHDGKKNGVLVEVRRNDELIKRLLEQEQLFWERVLSKNSPDLSSRDYLIPDDLTLLQQLRDAKELAENAQTAYEKAKEKVVATYKHDRISGAGVKLFKVERQGSINYKSIPAIQNIDPNDLEQYRGKGSVSWTIRMDGFKEQS